MAEEPGNYNKWSALVTVVFIVAVVVACCRKPWER